MRLKIATIAGEFTVEMSYKPIGDDDTLLKLTNCINNAALPLIQKGITPEAALNSIDETELEAELYASLTAGGGSGQKLTLSLKSKTITFHRF